MFMFYENSILSSGGSCIITFIANLFFFVLLQKRFYNRENNKGYDKDFTISLTPSSLS